MSILSILRPYRSVSTDAICVLTGILPIKITLMNENIKYGILNENLTIEIEDAILSKEDFMKNLKTYDFPDYNKLNNLQVQENGLNDSE